MLFGSLSAVFGSVSDGFCIVSERFRTAFNALHGFHTVVFVWRRRHHHDVVFVIAVVFAAVERIPPPDHRCRRLAVFTDRRSDILERPGKTTRQDQEQDSSSLASNAVQSSAVRMRIASNKKNAQGQNSASHPARLSS